MKKHHIYILIGVCLILTTPIGIDKLIIGNSFPSNISNTEWVGFLGSYIGALIGGLLNGTIYQNKHAKRRHSVLLVDDLYKTGATLTECVRVLRGDPLIDKIFVLTITKTKNPN